MEEIQGAWKQIAYERVGVQEPLDELDWKPRVTFSDYAFVATLADGCIPNKGTYTLDPNRQSKAIDLTDAIGADAGKTFLAIYSLDGDRLVSFARPTPGGSGQRNSKPSLGKS